MAKISTPKIPVKTLDCEEQQSTPESSLPLQEAVPAHLISNVLNYSKALEVKKTSAGKRIGTVLN